MTEDRALPFSQREGLEEVPGQLRLKQFPVEARTMIWSFLYDQIKSTRHVDAPGIFRVGGVWEEILKAKHVFLDVRPLDEWKSYFNDRCAELKGRILGDPFNRVFDLIEFIIRHGSCPADFINGVSWVFRRFQLAYIIDPGPPPTIFPATTAEEGNELKRNLAELETSGLVGCATHLRNASKCINDGDSAASIRESIHAVESVAKKIAPKANTLSAALSVLKKQRVLHHKELASALGKLYNYTSDEDGIRHALSEAEANVTQDEALFMLGACASFASYLWRKHKAATAP